MVFDVGGDGPYVLYPMFTVKIWKIYQYHLNLLLVPVIMIHPLPVWPWLLHDKLQEHRPTQGANRSERLY